MPDLIIESASRRKMELSDVTQSTQLECNVTQFKYEYANETLQEFS